MRRYNGMGGSSANGAGLSLVEDPKVDGDANSLMASLMAHKIQAKGSGMR